MPSKFGIRRRIRQLFHHSPKKSDLPDSSSTTEYRPSNTIIPSPAPIPLLQGGTNGPCELHHSLPDPDHRNIVRTSSYQPPGEGVPLGAGLDDVLYPPNNHSTIQSVLLSPEPSEPDIDLLGDLGPRPPGKTEPYIGKRLAHPGSEILATPISEAPPTLWGSAGYEAAPSEHTGLFTEGYVSGSANQQLKENSNRTHDFSDFPPEAINVLPEPPRLEVHSDRTSLAFESAKLRRRRPSGQQSSGSSTRSSTYQSSAKGERERSVSNLPQFVIDENLINIPSLSTQGVSIVESARPRINISVWNIF